MDLYDDELEVLEWRCELDFDGFVLGQLGDGSGVSVAGGFGFLLS